MIAKIAEELLNHVYYMTSAAVSLDDEGRILSVRLFDTQFGGEGIAVHPQAACICLLSNHPEGFTAPYTQDMENLEIIRKMTHGKRVRLWITGEDIDCVEVALSRGTAI